MTQNDDVYAYLKTTLGISGTLNDLLFAYYKQQTGLSNVSFNDAKRAYFQQRYGKQGTINDVAYGIEGGTNLVTNPRGRDTSGTVTVRENLLPNPRALIDTATAQLYVPDNTNTFARRIDFSGLDTLLPGVTTGYRNTVPLGATAWAGIGWNVPVVSGTEYTLSMYVRRLAGNDPLGLAVSGIASSAVSVPASGWVRVSFTFTATSTSHLVGIRLQGTPTVENVFDVTGVMAEASPSPLQFFDGDTSPDPDLTPQWDGTPHASTSRLVGQNIVGWSGDTRADQVSYYSPTRDAVALINHSAENWFVDVPWEKPDAVETGLSRVVEIVDLVGGGTVELLPHFYGNTDYGLPVDVTGPTTFRRFYSVDGGQPTSNPVIRVSPMTPGQVLYVRDSAFDGEYDGPYFDGDSPNAKWNGTPHASTSTLFNPGRALI